MPQLWNHVRRAVTRARVHSPDRLRGSRGRYDQAHRSGTILVDPDATDDALRTGAINSRYFAREAPRRRENERLGPAIGISELAEITSKGGWPGLMHSSAANAQRVLRGYLDSVARTDIRRVDGVTRDPQKVLSVLRSLARNVATEVSLATIAADAGGADGPVAEATASSYLVALDRLMVLEEQPAWAPRLRSRSRLRSAPKRHFCDPSLAVAALQVDPAQLLKDLNYFGFLFESLVVRDLRVYAQRNGGNVLHYRDNVGEVDAIVDAGERWGAIEVKLGVAHADAAAKNLKRFISRIDVEHRGEPAFLAVVLPAPYGYVREDGVHVIPIQALGP